MLKDKKKKKQGNRTQKFYDKISAKENAAHETGDNGISAERPKKKRGSIKNFKLKDLNRKKVLKILLIGCVAIGIIGCTAVGVIIAKTPSIDTDNIAEILTESTIIYDDKGNEVDTVFAENNRTNVKFEDLP